MDLLGHYLQDRQQKIRKTTDGIRSEIYEQLDCGEEISDERLGQIIDEKIRQKQDIQLALEERESIHREIFAAIRGLDVLQELLEDDSITEIMVNGTQDIFLERCGRLERCSKHFENKARLSDVAQRIAAVSNRLVNESVPILDTHLEDGSRVSIVLPPVALNGPVITIRKFYDTPLTIERLTGMGAITKEAAQFLEKAVRAGYNIFISGGTGCGKTTFLNALSNFIPKDERIITIEDSAELQIKNAANLVRLEARNANVEGKNEVTIRDLLKASLRMRPDRIIVGEIRGAEAIDMLQAMNTGHDGSMSTGHANSIEGMLKRLEAMFLQAVEVPVDAIRNQITEAIDIMIHVSRMQDGSRKVMEIAELSGLEDGVITTNPLFQYRTEEDGITGALRATGNTLQNQEKLMISGHHLPQAYTWKEGQTS